MRWLAIAIIVSCLFNSCSYKEGYENINVANKFMVEVPHYMSESNKLHPDAVFQYENKFRTTYFLILEDKPATYQNQFAVYADSAVTDLSKRLEEATVTKVSSVTSINGNEAIVFDIEAKLTGEKVYYRLATIKAGNTYYRLLGWTVLKYDMEGYKAVLRTSVAGYITDIQHSVSSFNTTINE